MNELINIRGFKVTCGVCGNEQSFTDETEHNVNTDKITVYHRLSYGEVDYIRLECKCDNYIDVPFN